MTSYKIFMGMGEISGMMLRLNEAFKMLHIESLFVSATPYAFDKENDQYRQEDNQFVCRYRKYVKEIKHAKNIIERTIIYIKWVLNILHLFIYAVLNYNVFIFNYGVGILGLLPKCYFWIYKLEFILLRILRKKVIMWYVGSDSRAPYADGYFDDYYNPRGAVKRKAEKVRFVDKWAIVIDNPASAHFHTKEYIMFQAIGIPINEKELVVNKHTTNREITILHAPSSRSKGTDKIREIIENLKNKGYSIQYIEISGVPHAEVMNAIAQSDIVIDQLYSDTPLAGLAVEAGINAVPVVVGGYFANDCKEILKKIKIPSIFCLPSEVEKKVEQLINNKQLRENIGRTQKEFILSNYSSEEVARKFLMIINEKVPKEWYYNPYSYQYIYGGGVSHEQMIYNVRQMMRHYGTESLCITDKKKLLAKYQRACEEYVKESV